DLAPSVPPTSPADAADLVAATTTIVENFTLPDALPTCSFSLECPTGTAESFTVSGSPGSSITLDPTSDLPEGTVCSVKVIANQRSEERRVGKQGNTGGAYTFSIKTDAAPDVTGSYRTDG